VLRLRTALLAAAVAASLLPALAQADPASCLEPDPEAALCLATGLGGSAQQAEGPLVGPRDTARTTADLALEQAGVCDPTDHAHCLLPFPNDRFTVADPTTATGRRLNLSPLAMPRNVSNKPIDPTELNRNDGWSPGSAVLTSVPGLDVKRSRIPDVTDPGASMSKNAPVLLLDAATGHRHPYTAELDGNPTDGEQPLLIVRPAVNATGTSWPCATWSTPAARRSRPVRSSPPRRRRPPRATRSSARC
jgi:hypothetical protein